MSIYRETERERVTHKRTSSQVGHSLSMFARFVRLLARGARVTASDAVLRHEEYYSPMTRQFASVHTLESPMERIAQDFWNICEHTFRDLETRNLSNQHPSIPRGHFFEEIAILKRTEHWNFIEDPELRARMKDALDRELSDRYPEYNRMQAHVHHSTLQELNDRHGPVLDDGNEAIHDVPFESMSYNEFEIPNGIEEKMRRKGYDEFRSKITCEAGRGKKKGGRFFTLELEHGTSQSRFTCTPRKRYPSFLFSFPLLHPSNIYPDVDFVEFIIDQESGEVHWVLYQMKSGENANEPAQVKAVLRKMITHVHEMGDQLCDDPSKVHITLVVVTPDPMCAATSTTTNSFPYRAEA